MSSIIESLQTSQLLWHASDSVVSADNLLPSGYAELDQKLGGGWPDKGIVELQIEKTGIGEIRLLLPLLVSLQQQQVRQQSLCLWVAPPARLNAQVLQSAGFSLENTIVAVDVCEHEAFWIAQRSLSSGCCSAVILWCNEFTPSQAKRLQLAAKEGNCLGIVLRPPSEVEQSLPISVRMNLSTDTHGLKLAIGKRLGGYPVSPFNVDMSTRWPQLSRKRPNKPKLQIVN